MDDDQVEAERWCKAHQVNHPIGDFYKIKAARYAGGYRYICKQLADAKNAAARRNAPEGSQMRATIRKANRESIKRHPEANRARVAAHRARKKGARAPDSE
jgi:hypothetical protein